MRKQRSATELPLHHDHHQQRQQQQQRHVHSISPSSTHTSRSTSSRSVSPRQTPSAALHRSASQRIQSIIDRNKNALQVQNEVTNALAQRAFHLPGYNYAQDLAQYLVNNHLIFGMCCKHKQHPLGTRIRALNLLGSAICGLAITNVFWLAFVYYDEDPDSVLFKLKFGDTANFTTSSNDTFAGVEITLPGPKDDATAEQLGNTLQVTKGMILLWTLGGSLHAVYDSTIWYASACACCLPGNRCERLGYLRNMGGYFTVFVVVLVTAVASFAVVLRATLMSNGGVGSGNLVEDATHVGEGVKDLGVFEFVVGYFVEFFLALFLYYPLFAYILFSGILGCCGKVSMLGGRPYEMAQLEKRSASPASNNSSSSRSSSSSSS